MDITGFLVVTVAGYLMGSLPFAYVIAKFCGVDILKSGSGNPGATNVKRTCGKKAGNLCFVLDALKGFAAAGWPLWLAPHLGLHFENPQMMAYAGLAAAVVGHSFSVFLKFRGGKGVSTTIGGLAAVMWGAILVALVVWVVVFYSTRYVSVASICMAAALPVAAGFLYGWGGGHFYIALAIAVVVIVRHRSNIARLIKGTENRF